MNVKNLKHQYNGMLFIHKIDEEHRSIVVSDSQQTNFVDVTKGASKGKTENSKYSFQSFLFMQYTLYVFL